MNNDLENLAEKFRQGKIGIFPTDTAYGVGCRIDDVNAVNRVYKVRNRPHEKALIVLVSSYAMAEKYIEISPDVKSQLIDKYWPGGLTIILNCKVEKVLSVVRANGKTLAVRFPNQQDLIKVISMLGLPIVAPSANFSGVSTPFSLEDVSSDFKSKVDFVMNGVCTIRGVSTIVDATEKPWKIVRQGVVNIKN